MTITSPSSTREDRILLVAAAPAASPARLRRLERLLTPEVDWPALVRRVDRHGIAPLLDGHLRRLPAVPVPPDVRAALAVRSRACVAANLRLRHELGRLLAALTRAGVAAMPLKGPVLADQLYPAPLLRPSADLDVLVPADAVAAAENVLEKLGYARRPDDEQGADYHTIFTSDHVDVELHRDLGERHVSRPDVHAIWASATRTRWAGHAIWSMAVPDQLLYLAFHAAKDGLASVRPLADIALLVTRHRDTLPGTDRARRVRAAHFAPVTYLALRESRALLGAPVPRTFLDAIRPRHAGWALAQRLYAWRGGVLHVAEELLVGPFMAVLLLLWEDTWRARLRHLERNLLPSPGLRRRWAAVPAPLSYPMWIARAVGYLVRQLAARHAEHGARS